MQLGTRWAIGSEPPARLPAEVASAVREVEETAESSAGSPANALANTSRYWTLTWLEGRPVVTLDPAPGSEDVTVIRTSPADGSVHVSSNDPGDEWEYGDD